MMIPIVTGAQGTKGLVQYGMFDPSYKENFWRRREREREREKKKEKDKSRESREYS